MTSVGAIGCFALSALSFVPFIGVAVWILPRHVAPPPSDHDGSFGVRTGMREILREPRLRGGLLTVLTTSVLCAPLMTFAPVLVKDAFHMDASHFSAAVAAFGLGGLLGATALLAIPPERDRRALSSACAIAYGLVVVLVAINLSFWALIVLFVLAGASMTASNIAANSILQTHAQPRLLGRTVSMYMLAMRGGISLGSLLTGVSVSFGGVRHALLVNGIVAVLVQLVVGRAWRSGTLPS